MRRVYAEQGHVEIFPYAAIFSIPCSIMLYMLTDYMLLVAHQYNLFFWGSLIIVALSCLAYSWFLVWQADKVLHASREITQARIQSTQSS